MGAEIWKIQQGSFVLPFCKKRLAFIQGARQRTMRMQLEKNKILVGVPGRCRVVQEWRSCAVSRSGDFAGAVQPSRRQAGRVQDSRWEDALRSDQEVLSFSRTGDEGRAGFRIRFAGRGTKRIWKCFQRYARPTRKPYVQRNLANKTRRVSLKSRQNIPKPPPDMKKQFTDRRLSQRVLQTNPKQ